MMSILFMLMGSLLWGYYINSMYWMFQMLIFLIMFIMLFFPLNLFYLNNLSYIFGYDMISYGLILLSVWICGLMLMSSFMIQMNNYYTNFFILNILLLLFLLICTFSSLNLFFFYLFFEGSLIPVLFLIMGWGYQPERLQAGIYLLFYTLFASLPLLLGIFFIEKEIDSMIIYLMKNLNLNFLLIYFSLILAFLVKLPMFFFHLWLPKAHVEAPVSGSMILAAIMLKLGSYGILRVMVILSSVNLKYGVILISLSLLGGVIVSMMCFHQVDLKSLIAYSSVVHMSIVLGGMISLNYWGFMGAYILMIGHGLCSSGLFCLVNINYERLMSRSMLVNKGLLNIMPSLTLWWFLFLSSNMAAPPSLNLMGEISLFNSLLSWSWFTMYMLVFLSFFSAGYSLYLFMYSQHGKIMNSISNYFYISSREYLLLCLHWIPLNFLVLKLDLMYMWF
uniref:NADH dehydrogenase subunit 4 n=1 Tax=Limnocentropus hysbald TaxID=1875661 RepID=UPI0022DCDF2E|nr:NADH dehydrogenase subunit 4 [Limnocentropus hysbald]UZZ44125.1 NADH dehydrogenase subunit 4 [Limnocentropus hysbald]